MPHSYAPYIYIPHAWHAFIAQPHLLGYLLSPTGTRGCNHTHHTHIHACARAPLSVRHCVHCVTYREGWLCTHSPPCKVRHNIMCTVCALTERAMHTQPSL